MRIVALEVQRFGCVKRARLELSSRLNILFGPNDVGKSTLLQAMRAALLLPHSSSAYKDFLPWQEPDATPEVALTLQVMENGLPRFYRVHKRFGHSAHLAWSNDGKSFSDDTRKAREVDEKLRRLLQWGVPAAGSGRGMPESFLLKVLMASQPEVTGILEAALAEDKDPSGRNRIMAAMEAMLEDPLFKKVLERAVERVKVAYSASGRERRGKGSPWVDLREKINEADEEVRRLQTLRNQSTAAIGKVRLLEGEVLQLEAALQNAKQHAGEVALRRQQQTDLGALEKRLEVARAALEKQTGKVDAVEQARKQLGEIEAALVAKRAAMTAAEAGVVAARDALAAAEQQVRQLESDDAAREVELKKSQLKERQTQLQADIAAQTRLGERTQAIGKLHEAVSAAESRVTQLEAEAAKHETAFRARQSESDQMRTEHDRVRQVARYLQYRERVTQFEAAEAAGREAKAEQRKAEESRQQLEQLEAALAEQQLPDAALLERLRGLHRDLEVREAALDLGLIVVVAPDSPPLDVEITADAVGRKEKLFAPGRFTAREALSLKLPGATVALTAAAAAQVQELRASWKDTGEPVLKAAGASSLAELEQALKVAETRRQECQRLHTAASDHEAAATKLGAQAARAGTLREAVDEARRALAYSNLNALEQQAASFPTQVELARSESQLEQRRAELDQSASQARGELQTSQAQLEAARNQLGSAQQAYRDAAAQGEGDWHDTLTQVVQELGRLKAEKADIDTQLETLAVSQNEELGSAQQTLTSATEALATAIEAEETAEQAMHTSEKELASQRARLEMLEAAAQVVDTEGVRQAFEQLQQEFESARSRFLESGPPLSEDDIALASTRVDQAQAALNAKSSESLLARGGLIEVGGNVVEEELQEAEQALEQRKRELKELEVEYRAWQLLQNTLREAEKSEATNLGEKLGGPLQTRFADLTGGRYTQIDVGTDLRTRGFSLAGDMRPVSALSAGTQEQLSTLFRLCLAEALETAVVLDDHLSQTDSQKMQWFRDTLDEVTQKAQVLVISCWPEHYSLPAGKVDTARKIDAAAVVERY